MHFLIFIICLLYFPQNTDGNDYKFKEVVQKPIAPAYKEILEKTKNISLKHQYYLLKEEYPGFETNESKESKESTESNELKVSKESEE